MANDNEPFHPLALAIVQDAAPGPHVAQDAEYGGPELSPEHLDMWARKVILAPDCERVCVHLAVLARRAAAEGAKTLAEQLAFLVVCGVGLEGAREALMATGELTSDMKRVLDHAATQTTREGMAPPAGTGVGLRPGKRR